MTVNIPCIGSMPAGRGIVIVVLLIHGHLIWKMYCTVLLDMYHRK